MPLDQFGRNIHYLRISVTDHCNLRCVYCMPLTGLRFVPRHELLTVSEIVRAAEAALSIGFTKFRLTGGEPLLREDIVDIVRALHDLPGVNDVVMTTNGIRLPELAGDLVKAGLRRVNIHVDSLNAERLPHVMRFGRLDAIWAGIEAAERAGLTPLKLNAVVVRDFNDDDVVDLARLTIERDWHVRFIELMPFGAGECSRTSLSQFVPTPETREKIESALGRLTPQPSDNPSDEAVNFRLPGARGVVGFISPVSAPYCGTCNRMRLTADGKFHLCLLNDDEVDLKPMLRSGASLEQLESVLLQAVRGKPAGHQLDKGVSTLNRSMFQIGG